MKQGFKKWCILTVAEIFKYRRELLANFNKLRSKEFAESKAVLFGATLSVLLAAIFYDYLLVRHCGNIVTLKKVLHHSQA